MNQIDAMTIAIEALGQLAKVGNDEAGDALPQLHRIQNALIRRKVKASESRRRKRAAVSRAKDKRVSFTFDHRSVSPLAGIKPPPWAKTGTNL